MRKGKLRRKLIHAVPLETERLVLREIKPADAEAMYDYASRSEVTRFLLWTPHVNIDSTKGYIESIDRRYMRGLYGDWAVALKGNDRMIGTCGYANVDSSNLHCEIGYVQNPDYCGRGYMTEAVKAILALTFETLEFNSAELRIMQGNERSAKLAERVGFRLDRTVENELTVHGSKRTILHYIMSRADYYSIYG